jgi:transposase-like protein
MPKVKEKVMCPMCNGCGTIIRVSPIRKYTPEQRQQARQLYKKGYSLRSIGKALSIGESAQKVKSMMFAKFEEK